MAAYKAKGRIASGGPSEIISVCPGCGVKALLMAPLSHDVQDIIGANGLVAAGFGVRRCPDEKCRAIFFCQVDTSGALEIFPESNVELSLANAPPDVQEDAKEALKVYKAEAWKSTVVMCRRALQAACVEKGADKKKTLEKQIDELQTKGLLTVQLRDWAHQIRYFGNFGAHPDENIGDATKADAEQMIEFLSTFLKYMYDMPARIKAAQARSGKPKVTAPASP